MNFEEDAEQLIKLIKEGVMLEVLPAAQDLSFTVSTLKRLIKLKKTSVDVFSMNSADRSFIFIYPVGAQRELLGGYDTECIAFAQNLLSADSTFFNRRERERVQHSLMMVSDSKATKVVHQIVNSSGGSIQGTPKLPRTGRITDEIFERQILIRSISIQSWQLEYQYPSNKVKKCSIDLNGLDEIETEELQKHLIPYLDLPLDLNITVTEDNLQVVLGRSLLDAFRSAGALCG